MAHKIETPYGVVRSATTHPYIVIGAHRRVREGATTAEFAAGTATEFGAPFIVGYARTPEAAEKRVAKERRRVGTGMTVQAYHVASGQRVGA